MIDLLKSALNQDAAIREWRSNWGKPRSYWIQGQNFSARTLLTGTLDKKVDRLIIFPDREHLERWREDLLTWLPGEQVLEFPNADWFRFSTLAKGLELEMARQHILNGLCQDDSALVVLATAESVVQPVPAPEEFLTWRLTLKKGQTYPLPDFLSWLVENGYERTDQVEDKGHFAARGGIVDFFPPDQELPIRLEWFDDEIDSIREFVTDTQRTVRFIDSLDILPVRQPEHLKKEVSLLSYFDPSDWIVIEDPIRCKEAIEAYRIENEEFASRMGDWKSFLHESGNFSRLFFSLLLRRIPGLEQIEPLHIDSRNLPAYQQQTDLFIGDLNSWVKQKRQILVWMTTEERATGLRNSLVEEGLPIALDEESWQPGSILIKVGWLEEGCEFPQSHLVVLTEKNLLGRAKKPRRVLSPKRKGGIKHFRDIHAGDYVVHMVHGIGRYMGVETITVEDHQRDYLLIRYAGEDKLYLPTDQVGFLQKYIGSEGDAPKVSRLGGNDWNKVKAKAKASAVDLAKELVEIYAQRQAAVGYAFEPDTAWQSEFEETFPYEETEDQLHAIEDVKVDMEKTQPMDRLICGDVGFGKTEVAIRAAFKSVMGGKQVAILVPTTVLAYQHYQTFSSRLAGFGPTVELLSRYRTLAERRKILKRVESGQIDILIGTHSILQKGVQFKDLGLLVVDEEQRFGVAQKEKWKSWRPNVDILSLSATPIPRTLHMSLTGIRDMSIIDTPPQERLPVQTYVVEHKEDLMKEAIERELRRGGQVYFIYNRIEGLEKFVYQIQEMIPEARVAMAHGRMTEVQLEDVMVGFYEGEYDILVSTSIVENGLDVPNANTILVYDADKLGLSQLYQMRGRVGRSRRQAYAYFIYEPNKVLTEVAEKRLQTLLEYTELGAGFKIAMRDLEIRGAGNLLGGQQHGQIINVGFEMYCQLIEEAVHELQFEKDGTPPPPREPEGIIDLRIDAHIPGDYIPEPLHKMEIYQAIAELREKSELDGLIENLLDRFGQPPKEVNNLLTVAALRIEARKAGVKSITEKGRIIEIIFGENSNVWPEKWIKWHSRYSQALQLIKRIDETVIRVKTNYLTMPPVEFLRDMLQDFHQKEKD